VVCQAATPTRKPNEAILPAAVLKAFFACAACAIVYDRLDDYSIAWLVVFNTLANLLDSSAKFVAEG
jgi:hypothetical protein